MNDALLKGTSRSFYLTIRVLPAGLRAPVGLAYLLARASDTVADTAQTPVQVRLEQLQRLQEAILRPGPDSLAGLATEVAPPDPAERLLLENLGPCIAELASQPEQEKREITSVLEKIIRGQQLDLERTLSQGGALRDAGQLEEYTYLVAGCVGEFWTRICALKNPGFARLDLEKMCELGVRFGKGLQLVNILRDIPADLRAGRSYLPADELQEAGADPKTMKGAEPVFEKWRLRALEHLESAQAYIEGLRPGRVRYACILPWHLGVLTLKKLRVAPWKRSERIKVMRAEVRRSCWLAIGAAFSSRALRAMGRRTVT